MYFYNIGYNSYEESDYSQLWHEKKYSEKEFKEIIFKIILDIFKNRTEEDKKWEKTFQHILPEVVEQLIENFGFKEVEFDAEFNVFGWADLTDENDWKQVRDEELDEITKYLKENQ